MSGTTPTIVIRERTWLSVVALVLSLAAVLVSIGVAVVPGLIADNGRNANAGRYLRLVASTKQDEPIGAQSYAAVGSDADRFASFVQAYWSAVDVTSKERKNASSTVSDLGGGSFKVCFANVHPKLFRDCVTAARFEFDGQGLIRRFTIDSIPVSAVVHLPVIGGDKLTKDDNGPVDGYLAGSVYDTSAGQRLVVLALNRHEDVAAKYPVTFESVLAQDVKERNITVPEWSFPNTLYYFGHGYAVVRVPDTATYLYVCWVPPSLPQQCQWFYGLD